MTVNRVQASINVGESAFKSKQQMLFEEQIFLENHFKEQRETDSQIALLLVSKRCNLYRVFRELFSYPTKDLINNLKNGSLRSTLESDLSVLSQLREYSLPSISSGFYDQLQKEIAFDAFEIMDYEDSTIEHAYTQLFDVGTDGSPPCSLYGGEYTQARMHEMEELVRFYNHFGLAPGNASQEQELPDHITVELEFLHYLSYRQAKTLSASIEVTAFLKGQRDFIGRHIGSWIQNVDRNIQKTQALPIYRELVRLLKFFLEQEMKYLVQILGPIDRTKVSPQTYSAGRIL